MLSDRGPRGSRAAPRGVDDAKGTVVVSYSLAALAKVSGATVYRIRHYVQGGLVAPARRAGSASVYDESHVERLAVIEALRARRVSFRAIREHVRTSTAKELRVLAGLEEEEEGDAPERAVAVAPRGRGANEMSDAVDAIVCVAADALDVSPRTVRPALVAALERMSASELTVADVIGVLRGARAGA
jgi:DNA-binding transcriptional MerR regulator